MISKDHLYRFGAFELDTSLGELRRGGVRLPLQGQPLQVLEILLSSPQQLVSREQLRQALWPDGTFVNFDDVLNHNMRRLRHALEDGVDSPRFIETLPRRGYRFLSEVEAAHPDVQGSLQNPQVQPAVAKGFRYVIRWVAPVLLICIVAFFYFRRHLAISGLLFLGAAHQLCWVRDLSFVCARRRAGCVCLGWREAGQLRHLCEADWRCNAPAVDQRSQTGP